MSAEEQNDSPAFRLRPRRAAPKSYYTVRLEYSANPAAFVRERPRNSLKRRVFSQKTGSNSTTSSTHHGKYQQQQTTRHPNQSDNSHYSTQLAAVQSKKERELDERRVRLHRQISQSITTDTPISPFIERLQVGELSAGSIYEHNYITARIKRVERPSATINNNINNNGNERLLVCLCQSIDCPSEFVHVHLHDEYANETLVRQDKLISIAKFKTSVASLTNDPSKEDTLRVELPPEGNGKSHEQTTTTDNSHLHPRSAHHQYHRPNVIKLEDDEEEKDDGNASSQPLTGAVLPFNVIVKYDELTELITTPTGGAPAPAPASTPAVAVAAAAVASGSKRPLIPFVSITDMIEHPTEPFVEMSFS